MTPDQLRIQYQDNVGRAERLREAVVVQLLALLNSKELTLGVPIESRVKNWDAIEEKIQRKNIEIENIFALQDLVGVRAIFLFRSDLYRSFELVAENFDVVSQEDTSNRLSESEFGYQSQHFVIRLPKTWLSLPSLAGFGDFFVELQIRTLAQHIWAAASHKLQYKQEAGVPPPLRRAINRVSALLETVDLEFERVLDERRSYISKALTATPGNEPINVDNLTSLLSELLPPENKKNEEDYADLLKDLTAMQVITLKQLKEILISHLEAVKEKEKGLVAEYINNPKLHRGSPQRVDRIVDMGVIFTHVGLVRHALRLEFGDEAVASVVNNRKITI